ncbi:unnamed protein product [Periconia digitata]|uniref:Uncharacterized protein n=1 Tax=Periconia digitata TaxID=1303443 RepID=A0A9W4XVB0_9PLEO|nr:unnamed protein product [Periconia digitata]
MRLIYSFGAASSPWRLHAVARVRVLFINLLVQLVANPIVHGVMAPKVFCPCVLCIRPERDGARALVNHLVCTFARNRLLDTSCLYESTVSPHHILPILSISEDHSRTRTLRLVCSISDCTCVSSRETARYSLVVYWSQYEIFCWLCNIATSIGDLISKHFNHWFLLTWVSIGVLLVLQTLALLKTAAMYHLNIY